MLNKDDKAELRQMFIDVLSTEISVVKGEINLLKLEIKTFRGEYATIKEDVKDHDDRLDTLEMAEVDHANKCPVVPRVKILEDKELTRESINKFLVKTVAITATVTGVIIAVFEFILKA